MSPRRLRDPSPSGPRPAVLHRRTDEEVLTWIQAQEREARGESAPEVPLVWDHKSAAQIRVERAWRTRMYAMRASGLAILAAAAYFGAAIIGAPDRPSRFGLWGTGATPPAPKAAHSRELMVSGTGSSKSRAEAGLSLTRLLRRYSSGDPLDQGLVIHKIRKFKNVYEPFLIGILEAEQPDLIVSAALVCGRLKLSSGQHVLYRLSKDAEPPVRAAAIRGLGHYRFWTRRLVAGMLASSDPEVLIAALEVARLLDDRPIPEILRLLVHPDQEVRDAAFEAVPRMLDEEGLAQLFAIVEQNKGEVALTAIKLAGLMRADRARDSALFTQLRSTDWRIRSEALRSLAKGRTMLHDTGPVWGAITRADADIAEQVLAFIVLEYRRSVNISRVRRIADRLHPVVRLHAARALITAGDPRGVRVLVDLLSTQMGPGVDDEDRDCARKESVKLLQELSGRDYGIEPDKWGAWLRKMRPLEPRELDTPPRTTW